MSNVGEFENAILEAYEQTTFQVKDGSGKLISFTVKNWQTHPFLKNKRFAIITAFNPMNKVVSAAENQKNNLCLEQVLKEMGLLFYASVGALGDHSEESFTIEGITLSEARALGRRFEQYAILYCDQNGPYFSRC